VLGPVLRWKTSLTWRSEVSSVLPAANGTITRTGLAGKAWACAGPAASPSAAVPSAAGAASSAPAWCRK
jgi:hypothetical protein